MSDSSFYNKINQVAADELVDFLGHNQTELVIKIQGQYVKTHVNSKKSDRNLGLNKFSTYDFSNEPIVCSFQVKEDLYFFKSFMSSTNLDYALEVPADIYQLQRRNDYRVSMPLGMAYKCETLDRKKIKVEIRDLSLGGCQISLNGHFPEIKKDDEVRIYLKLDRFEFPSIALLAKHVKVIESQNNTLIGASYLEPDGPFLAELQAMIMYLDRIHRGKSYG
jgi:hypothetical protein